MLKGAKINEKDQYGLTALIAASAHALRGGRSADPQWKADKDLQDKEGNTALMWAIMEGEEVAEAAAREG